MTTQPTTAPVINLTIDEKEAALLAINFFVGGLTDAGIDYHYSIQFEA